jgi:hypothetical protein
MGEQFKTVDVLINNNAAVLFPQNRFTDTHSNDIEQHILVVVTEDK